MYSSVGAYYVPTSATPIPPTSPINLPPTAGLGADEPLKPAVLAAYCAVGALFYFLFIHPERRRG